MRAGIHHGVVKIVQIGGEKDKKKPPVSVIPLNKDAVINMSAASTPENVSLL